MLEFVRHLISMHIPFSKVVNLPTGQQKTAHGPGVCVPVNVENTVRVLPRQENDYQLIRVKLKRKLGIKAERPLGISTSFMAYNEVSRCT